MNRERVLELLEGVQRGEVEPRAALESLARLPFVDLPGARVDTHRALRHGLPEVIYAPGKTTQQIAEIVRALREADQDVLVTRLAPEVAEPLRQELGAGEYDPVGRLFWLAPAQVPILGKGTIAVVCAGTADLPVAAEAIGVARRFGNKVESLHDVGCRGTPPTARLERAAARGARVDRRRRAWKARCPPSSAGSSTSR